MFGLFSIKTAGIWDRSSGDIKAYMCAQSCFTRIKAPMIINRIQHSFHQMFLCSSLIFCTLRMHATRSNTLERSNISFFCARYWIENDTLATQLERNSLINLVICMIQPILIQSRQRAKSMIDPLHPCPVKDRIENSAFFFDLVQSSESREIKNKSHGH